MDYLVGVDIGGSKIAAGLVRGSRILDVITVPTPKTRKALVDAIIQSIDTVSKKTPSGIGIGVAGFIDKKGNWIRSPNIPCVNNIPLKSIIKRRFRKKVRINNDANCFALAEAIVGQGKGKKLVFGLILGTGTGGGIIFNRRIIEGVDFKAGEIGGIPYKESHIESYCSGRFIWNMAVKNRLKSSNPKDVASMAKHQKKARAIYEQLGYHVGYLVSIIIRVVNPDMIVIGGGLSNDFPLFRRSLMSSMRKHLFFKQASKTIIRKTESKDYGILGAAMLLRDH